MRHAELHCDQRQKGDLFVTGLRLGLKLVGDKLNIS